MKNNCIFCQIIDEQKDLIYQDELTAALLDIYPVEPGHILIVPKKHFNTWLETEEKYLTATAITTQKIAKQLTSIFPDIVGFNIIVNNGAAAQQMVFHYHVHLIPKYQNSKKFKIPHLVNNEAQNSLAVTKALLQEKLK